MDGRKRDCQDVARQDTADPFQDSPNQPIFVDSRSGEVRIQLEGSHTTTSETDNNRSGLSVQFSGIQHDPSYRGSPPSSSPKKNDDESGHTTLAPPTQLSANDFVRKNIGLDLEQIEKDNEAIGQRFKQILDMFDTFSKNLETLELQTTPIMGRSTRDRNISLPLKTDEDGGAMKVVFDKYQAPFEDAATERNSISPTTSIMDVQFQSVRCQTSLHDDICIEQNSTVRSVSGTSRSEMQNSLNNYARPEMAMSVTSPVPGHPLKMIDPATVIAIEPCSQPFNTIHIEALSTTSSTALHRPPLCQRLWDVIMDFFTAICLCLQVNRDCIICLGFFAAFVVSASFLTAFFYRALSVSPPLWQPAPIPIAPDANGMTGGIIATSRRI